jgi:DNA-binding response OmpR family regulator
MKKTASLYDLLIRTESALPGRNSHREQPLNKRGEPTPLRRTLILVVEPDKEIEREYKHVFRDEGYDLEVVSSFAEAIRQLRNAEFDCIIIDVDLPDMAGYDAVSVIKAIERKANIIITAAKNTKELEARIREEDIFYYYIKSFDRDELKLAVQNALTRSEREVNTQ